MKTKKRATLTLDDAAEQDAARRGVSTKPTRKQRAAAKREAKAAAPQRAQRRGFMGAGRGESAMLNAPREWRGTSMQVCGLFPWINGSATPFAGAPLGIDMDSSAPLGCDPIEWFYQGIINNPSMFILGLPGYGKSTLVRHMNLALNGRGVIILVPGDLKPDEVDLVKAMGGEVIQFAPGRGHLNILDPGEITEIAARLPEEQREQLLVDAHSRKLELLSALITILRKDPVSTREYNILDRAIHLLERDFEGIPVIQDLLDLIVSRPAELSDVALDRGNADKYADAVEELVASLMSLTGSGIFGDMFAKQTSARMSMDRPAVFDLSQISDTQRDVQAAALMACWSQTFAAVDASHALADAGLAPNRTFFIVLDELWRALRSGPGMVDRIDSLTRLNRNEGVGQAMITHTMSDLDALADEADRQKARGFVERAGMVVAGALPRAEMAKLNEVVKLSEVERNRLMSWADPGSWSRIRQARTRGSGKPRQAPGVGKFMVKVGGRPGICVATKLTPSEIALNDTNKRWTNNPDGHVNVFSANEGTNALVSGILEETEE